MMGPLFPSLGQQAEGRGDNEKLEERGHVDKKEKERRKLEKVVFFF